MDPVARKKLNLDVLMRHDPNIHDILDQSSHAVVYKFDAEKQNWEKLGYEGVIFLTKGKHAPYFGLYLLNRLSIENFSQHLTDFEEINLTDEFIIYNTSEEETFSLWLYQEKDRKRILAKILKLHEEMKRLTSAPNQPKAPMEAYNSPSPNDSTSPLQNARTGLLEILSGPQKSSQIPQHPTMTQQMFQQQQMPFMQTQQYDNHFVIPTNANATPESYDRDRQLNENGNGRRHMTNHNLTKPFYPPSMNMSPTASPSRNSDTLLQTLHGGLPPPPPPLMPMGMPLLPQQAIGLMRPELNRRFAGRPLLSKPEFIQQLLNMIQCDPTFFEVLYENYKCQMNAPLPPPYTLNNGGQ